MNSLQKPHNYYEKYMKYKTKYIEYKNKLLVVNGNRSGGGAIVGGGTPANIKFYADVNLRESVIIDDVTQILKTTPLYIKIMVSSMPYQVYKYEVVEPVGNGTTGTVFKIKQIIPQQPEPEMFVIKLTILKNVNDDAHNEMEGINIGPIYVPDRVQALFQGKTGKIDFAIFNYLGQDFKTFLRDYSSTMTAKTILSLITRLHKQLYGLNRNMFFHNDIKMPNIVVKVSTKVDEKTSYESTEYVPSIIDYGRVTSEKSQMGTTESMCLYGCASFLLEKITEEKEILKNLQSIAVSSDYVGFFNIIICLLSPNYCAYDIYLSILELKGGYSPDKLLHILCLLCYVSNSAECDNLLKMPICVEIVQKIDTKLEGSNTYMALFTPFISDSGREITHMGRRLSFLCFIYSKIISGTGNVKFVHISKLPKFLFDISCCLDLRFDLEQFNANFGRIFNEELSEPAPEPTQPEPTPSAPTSEP